VCLLSTGGGRLVFEQKLSESGTDTLDREGADTVQCPATEMLAGSRILQQLDQRAGMGGGIAHGMRATLHIHRIALIFSEGRVGRGAPFAERT
jgi:hypothetical protein